MSNGKTLLGSIKDAVSELQDGNIEIDTIYHKATILGGHTAMAWLTNNGCYLLERVSKL